MTQEDEHYRENPSNHELLTVRGVDRRAFLKMFRAQITVYWIWHKSSDMEYGVSLDLE